MSPRVVQSEAAVRDAAQAVQDATPNERAEKTERRPQNNDKWRRP